MCSSLFEVYEDEALDRGIEKEEIAKLIRRLQNNKTGGSDGVVGELLNSLGPIIFYAIECVNTRAHNGHCAMNFKAAW